ncbi:MAG: ribosomal protein S18-alanine N-acetyltransferase [Oscillospiraceae bacterium]|nr:ribosomal protein S18-alanine N-acetyltransferase [Oscillospiraceae bacterium]
MNSQPRGICLFVCTGNTCRSPLAAAMFERLCRQQGVSGVQIFSAGLAASDGCPATAHMLQAAQEYSVDLAPHRSRFLTTDLLQEAELVVCLSASHALTLSRYVEERKLRVLGGGVSDPFSGDIEEYRSCVRRIQAALPALVTELRADFGPHDPDCRVVPMSAEHLDAAAELERRCFSHPWSRGAIAEGMAHAGARYLAALWGERLAGYLGICQVLDQADIANVAVDPAFRRKGVANALLARAETQAILRGCAEIRLEVRESNAAARGLYAARGYQEAGARPGYYEDPGEDALLLTLMINN